MTHILTLSAGEQARLIRERRISSRELIAAHLERIAAINPVLHAAVEVQTERALEEAAAADRELAAGSLRGPLHGVPFSIKDSIEQAGSRTTAGTWGRRDAAPSTADATVVARLRKAGGIPIGGVAGPAGARGGGWAGFFAGRCNCRRGHRFSSQ